ncbi:tetratricopeptide repeat protein [Synechococcus sp. RSCCF101]|nr:tetratricopeptide repeat protein [Synechococcus sp. RSCCF101]
MAEADRSWRSVILAALEAGDWPVAEGGLRRLLQTAPERPELLDLLGYACFMQGRFREAEATLRHALDAGSTSFWTWHKLGDVRRALHDPTGALQGYEAALRQGSDSPLTVRNAMEVLFDRRPAEAIERLQALLATATEPGRRAQILSGACQAALRVQGSELIDWLLRQGLADAAVQADAMHHLVLALDLDEALQHLPSCGPSWARALRERLQGLVEPGQGLLGPEPGQQLPPPAPAQQ